MLHDLAHRAAAGHGPRARAERGFLAAPLDPRTFLLLLPAGSNYLSVPLWLVHGTL